MNSRAILCKILVISLVFSLALASSTTGQASGLASASGKASLLLNTWNVLPNDGLDAAVNAFAASGSDIYMGGSFHATGDGSVTEIYHIARFDTSSNTWNPLSHKGLSNDVRALAVAGDYLYVGGPFDWTYDGAIVLKNIARYQISTGTWSPLAHTGLNAVVDTLIVSGNYLYVGGNFTGTADNEITNLNRIARYDLLTNTWSSLANTGLNYSVYALAMYGSSLYVGGMFTQTADGAVTNLTGIARYNTSSDTWSQFPHDGLNEYAKVYALALSGSNLYMAGSFYGTGDGAVTNLGNVARFDILGNSWHALANEGLWSSAYSLGVHGSDLYVGGSFEYTGDVEIWDLNYIARYDTLSNTWNPLPHQGLDGAPAAMAVMGSNMYLGGGFTQTHDGAVTLNNVALLSASNTAPTNIGLTNTTVAENQPAGTTVGQLSTTDPDFGDTFTYSFCGGADDASFQILGSALKSAEVFDYESQSVLSVCIRSTDSGGLVKNKTFTIYVGDVIEYITDVFKSEGGRDGWILESAETSEKGGSSNATAGTFRLGDDASDRQYRALLSFNTAGLPTTAVITHVKLRIKRSSSGLPTFDNLPFSWGNGLKVDVCEPFFGTGSNLQPADFSFYSAENCLRLVGTFKTPPSSGWYEADLIGVFERINKAGITQFRLRFAKDDNDDRAADYLKFFSGNSLVSSNRPVLAVEYYVP